jgi:membrane protease YdiL (CAAX protease family)
MRWPDYRPHAGFVAPAKERPSVWLFLVGLCVAATAFIALNQLFFDFLYSLAGENSDQIYEEILSGATPFAMYVQLFSFGFMTVSVALVARLLHRRAVRSLFGPGWPFLRQFSAVTVMLCLLTVVLFVLPPWDVGGSYVSNMALGYWVLLLPLSLLAVLVQTSAEEILFRGYIQQQLGARFRSPLIWMVLPSVLFGLAHYMPDAAGENAVIVALWAGLFGLLAADLTARSGTLGPAIALHFVNNLSAILIISLPDNLAGLALYVTPFSLDDTDLLRAWLPVDFMLMLVFWLAARLALRR